MKSTQANSIWVSDIYEQGALENDWSEYAVELITNKSANYSVSGNTTHFNSFNYDLESKDILVDYGFSTLLKKQCTISEQPNFDYSNSAPISFSITDWTHPIARPKHVSLDGKHLYKRNNSSYNTYNGEAIEHWYTDVPFSTNASDYTYMGNIAITNQTVQDIHVSHDGNYAYLTVFTGSHSSTTVYSYKLATPFYLSTATDQYIRSFSITGAPPSSLYSARAITASADGKKTVLFHYAANTITLTTRAIILEHSIPFDLNLDSALDNFNASLSFQISDSRNGFYDDLVLTGNPSCSEIFFSHANRVSVGTSQLPIYTYSSPSYTTISLANTSSVSVSANNAQAALSQNGEKLYVYIANNASSASAVHNIVSTKGTHNMSYVLNTAAPTTVSGVYDINDIKIQTSFADNTFNVAVRSGDVTITNSGIATVTGNNITLPFDNTLLLVNSSFTTTYTTIIPEIATLDGSAETTLRANDTGIISHDGTEGWKLWNLNNTFQDVQAEYYQISGTGNTITRELITTASIDHTALEELGLNRILYLTPDNGTLYVKESGSGLTAVLTKNSNGAFAVVQQKVNTSSTDALAFNPLGNRLLIANTTHLRKFNRDGSPWSITDANNSFTPDQSIPATGLVGIRTEGDNILYLQGAGGITKYTTGADWDLTNLTAVTSYSITANPGQFTLSDDGSKLYTFADDTFYRYSLTTESTATANVVSITGASNEILTMNAAIGVDTLFVEGSVAINKIANNVANVEFVSFSNSGDNFLYKSDWNVLGTNMRAFQFSINSNTINIESNTISINLKRSV